MTRLNIESLTSGQSFIVAGSTPDVTGELYDNDGSALLTAAITSFQFSLRTPAGAVINSRTDVDALNTGIGTLADGTNSDGVDVVLWTLKLTADDTAFQGSDGNQEQFELLIEWGWTDSGSVARTGAKLCSADIRRLATAAA